MPEITNMATPDVPVIPLIPVGGPAGDSSLPPGPAGDLGDPPLPPGPAGGPSGGSAGEPPPPTPIPAGSIADMSEVDLPFVLDAEAEAAIDATLARIETSIKDRIMPAQKSMPMQHVTAVLAEIEMRADRLLASIFGAK